MLLAFNGIKLRETYNYPNSNVKTRKHLDAPGCNPNSTKMFMHSCMAETLSEVDISPEERLVPRDFPSVSPPGKALGKRLTKEGVHERTQISSTMSTPESSYILPVSRKLYGGVTHALPSKEEKKSIVDNTDTKDNALHRSSASLYWSSIHDKTALLFHENNKFISKTDC